MDQVNLHDLKPGLLKQNLAINKPVRSDDERRQAKHKLQQLKVTLIPKRPHCLAINNMIAVLHYRLDEVHEATDILEKTLKEDPHNLNVLQDLIDIYQRDFRNEDKVECERRLKLVMDKIDTEEISETVRIFARCIAGKGFAWGFDIHPDSRETSRLDASIALYEQAVSVSGDKIDVKEKQDWLYYLALGYIRQNNIKRVSKDRVLYLKVFDKVLNCLTPNIESDDQQRRSASWCLLGSLFAQKPYNATGIPETIKNTELKAFWFHPEKCYLRALEIESRNWDAHNQLAHLYYKQGKEEEGLELLDKSLKINHGTSNSYALHIRAQIHLHVFNRQLQRKLQKKGHLRSQLEVGQYALKGCIQERDFEANTPFMMTNMISAVEGSAKILLVISDGFLENNFCKEALQLALQTQHIHKVILIMSSDISLPSPMKPLPRVDATNVINWKQFSEFLFQ
ncbi:tetratricopeptide repeat protein 22-like [Amphiura filiformis]|uniref:tetratricopeptide repeat protein 22-like n=1 Tax=Amphiura filiformis TaxID=82378 RepID=UPI003B22649E